MTPMNVMLSWASVSRLREPAPRGRDLDNILEAALRAPDHGRLRPWRFVLIRDKARIAFANVVEGALRRRQPEVSEALVERQRRKLIDAPLIIALGVNVRPEQSIPEVEQLLSVGAAAMNILNAIHALGFGGIWVTGPNSYDPHIAATLGFRAPDRLVGFLLVGTPIDEPPLPIRPDLSDHVIDWVGSLDGAPWAH
jgi:nitroreductase